MERKIYRLPEDLMIMPAPEEGLHAYRIYRKGGKTSAVLTDSSVAILFCVVGDKTLEEIEFHAREVIDDLPEGYVSTLFDALTEAGILVSVDSKDKPLLMLPNDEFECQRCGQACVVHWVGPLHRDEIKRILISHKALQQKYPHLIGVKPFRSATKSQDERFLNLKHGACIFLSEDNLCLLHKEYGIDAKPDICLLFPYVRVEDKDHMRISTSPGCFRLHKMIKPSFGSPILADNEKFKDLPCSNIRFNPVPDDFLETESKTLNILSRPDATLSMLARALSDDVSSPVDFPSLAVECLKRARQNYIEDPFLIEAMKYPHPFSKRIKEIASFLKSISDIEFPPFPKKWQTYVLETMKRIVFIREYLCFCGIEPAYAAWLICAWASSAIVQKSGKTGGEAYDLFGETMATWYRTFWFGPRNERIFETREEVLLILASFGKGWPK